MSKYDTVYFMGDNQASPSRFFQNEESGSLAALNRTELQSLLRKI